MRYHDTEFPDGTEPTVRRIPQGCDQQGRYPQAADKPWPGEHPWPVDELGIPLPEKEPLWVKAAAIVVGVIVVGALAAIVVGTALSAFGPVPPGK